MEKHMVVTEVMKNLKVAHVASEAQSAQAAATQQETPISNIPLAAPVVQSRNVQRIRSAPSRGALSLHGSRSMRSSRHMLPSTQSSSLQSFTSDAVQNPLLRALGLPYATASFQRTNSNMHLDTMSGPSKEMQTVAKQITVRCLRRWDGFLGIRASSDGLGRRSGIWRDKFDGVHYAVLLLAMSRLNETLSIAAQEPSESQLNITVVSMQGVKVSSAIPPHYCVAMCLIALQTSILAHHTCISCAKVQRQKLEHALCHPDLHSHQLPMSLLSRRCPVFSQ